jgi:hypothetical protein
VPIRSALQVAELLWPRFELRDGAVVLADARGARPSSFASRTEAGILRNPVHVLDTVRHRAGLRREPFWNAARPDFAGAVALGLLLAEAWAAKLERDFPRRRFRVYFTRDDDPVVRFHQVRRGEPWFLSEVAGRIGGREARDAREGSMTRNGSGLQSVLYRVFLVTGATATVLGLLLIWDVLPGGILPARVLGTCLVLALASAFALSATRLVSSRPPEDGA